MTIVLLILTSLFNILAQILLKNGVSQIKLEQLTLESAFRLLMSPYILFGALSFGLSFIFYIFTLSRGEVSKIAPTSQAIIILGVAIISILFFNESISATKIIALLMIIVSIFLMFI